MNEEQLYHPFLVGEKCYLRGLERRDLAGDYFQWFNDQANTRFMSNGTFVNSEARMQQFFEHVTTSKDDLVLAIIDKESNTHIGNIGIHRINWIYRTGELGIILGAVAKQGQGIGGEAVRLILEHSFKRLNLHKIFLITDENNEAALKCFKKNGFKQEGLLRSDCFRAGKYCNSVYMGCLLEDFEASL
ncbi:MAG: GNAT family N-acetyltransferase [Bdellovibrionales bacterium]|nr:GNAT family N-acetyltransferase [Bdellovibrionales bacterium]